MRCPHTRPPVYPSARPVGRVPGASAWRAGPVSGSSLFSRRGSRQLVVRVVQHGPQFPRVGGHRGHQQGGTGQTGEHGGRSQQPALRAQAVERRFHEEELPDGAMTAEHGRSVPAAGCTGPVRHLLVEERTPGAADGEPAEEGARALAVAAEDLFLAQHEPCGGSEFDGGPHDQFAAVGGDELFRQPVELGPLPAVSSTS